MNDKFKILKDMIKKYNPNDMSLEEYAVKLANKYSKVCKGNYKLQQENQKLEKQLEFIRNGEYYNQLKFERDMLQDIVDKGEISKEDKKFIDYTHRNTELLEKNQQLKEQQKELIANNKRLSNVAEKRFNNILELEKQLEVSEKARKEALSMINSKEYVIDFSTFGYELNNYEIFKLKNILDIDKGE